MKCKLCGKNVRSIAHWAKVHRKWLAGRPRKRFTKDRGKLVRHAHHGGQGEYIVRNGFHSAAEAARAVVLRYCPECGDAHSCGRVSG